ncbi:MAG TPA: hypothetical protein VM686_07790 [Polyangiaceae bacterium]|nr:hypothetical protein [Polyangiaceae bacterium]
MRVRPAALALVVASGATQASLASNLDNYYMSSEAALQAGAITADARGGGALWYNPAGLATISGLRLDVSVNALRLTLGGEADIESTDANVTIKRLPMMNLASVPAAVTLTRKFGDVGLGLGMFVPLDQTAFLRTQLRGRSTGGDGDIELGVDAHSTMADYFVGPGLGWRFSREVSLGASLFVNYRTELESAAVGGNVVPDNGERGALLVHETIDWQQIGTQLVCGLELHPDRKWAAGLTLRLPVVRLYQVRQNVDMQLVSVGGMIETENTFDEKSGWDAHVIAPPRVHIGLSRRFEAWHAALEANYQFPFSDEEQPRRLLAVANLRAGLRHQISPTLRVGGGLFSDRSPYDPKAFTDRALNFYGITLGGELSTPYMTVQKGDQAFTAPKALVFATGVALSYAVGVGRVVRADVVSAVPAELELREVPARMVAHELTLHIAATLGE